MLYGSHADGLLATTREVPPRLSIANDSYSRCLGIGSLAFNLVTDSIRLCAPSSGARAVTPALYSGKHEQTADMPIADFEKET